MWSDVVHVYVWGVHNNIIIIASFMNHTPLPVGLDKLIKVISIIISLNESRGMVVIAVTLLLTLGACTGGLR